MSKTYFNASINLPKGNSINFTSNSGKVVTITSNSNTLTNYNLILPPSIGTIDQVIKINNIINNDIILGYSDGYTGNTGTTYFTNVSENFTIIGGVDSNSIAYSSDGLTYYKNPQYIDKI